MTEIIGRVIIAAIMYPFFMRHQPKKMRRQMVVYMSATIFYPIFKRYIDPNNEISLIYLLTMLYPMIGVHELGHVLFARLVKADIKSISIGTGKKILSLGKIEINMIPMTGLVTVDGLESKKDRLMFYSGGVLLQLASIPVFIWLLDLVKVNKIFIKAVAVLFVVESLYNLLPIDQEYDGYKIMEALTSKGATS